MSAYEECQPKNPLDKEEGNLRDGEIWVDLSVRQDNKSKLKVILK